MLSSILGGLSSILKGLLIFIPVVAFYALRYAYLRWRGLAKPGDWKPRAVSMQPGDFDDDDDDRSASASSSDGGSSSSGGGASGSW